MTREICAITIEMEDAAWGGEDLVKDAWGRMLPWFTRRHGIESGEVSFTTKGDDPTTVKIKWAYATNAAEGE